MSLSIQKTLLITGIISSATILSSCVPTIIGGGAAVGAAATKEKGVSGAWSDTSISTGIKIALYKNDPDLHRLVDVNVQNSEVLLTGAVPTEKMHLDAVKISWAQQGVTNVIDKIGKSNGATLGAYASDTWITTKLKSTLMFDEDIQSRNYSIKTVSGQVYLMGIAQNQNELKKVIEHARNTDGVIKVMSYVRVKQSDPAETAEPADDSDQEATDTPAIDSEEVVD